MFSLKNYIASGDYTRKALHLLNKNSLQLFQQYCHYHLYCSDEKLLLRCWCWWCCSSSSPFLNNNYFHTFVATKNRLFILFCNITTYHENHSLNFSWTRFSRSCYFNSTSFWQADKTFYLVFKHKVVVVERTFLWLVGGRNSNQQQ